ncbi:DUF3710 domain-containing protein [Cellulomonas sp. PhB143]|uniref:DUF3710 domain-containing protein n=1 Tax=Cellulomonas sp. PhB143 TaxID=2485186 RepID=UPI000F46110E|nr:DUF3710 domain-containing protein [Cellulomonas sp. PhB143]ROS72982.1 uncharacterized protein DUF3710 [Cellulomonas sp. PhB143]
MPLFRRGAAQNAAKQDENVPDQGTAGPAPETGGASDGAVSAPASASSGGVPERGPYDVAQVEDRGSRLDLGAVWLPAVPGMELRMEADRKTQRITGAACTIQGSGLQVQAFAAPRTAGIWDEVRAEIAQSVARQGGAVDDIPGPFGRELLARLPAKGPDGQSGFRPARFVGVDGPRWFLRGVITGRAAVDQAQAKIVEAVFANIVVVRDEAARPPRDLLAMHVPGQPSATPLAPEGATPQEQTFDPLTRGPEITEIR